MQETEVFVTTTIYKFWWDMGDEYTFVELKTTGLTKEELRNKVQKLLDKYRLNAYPRPYNVSDFIVILRQNGIPAKEFEAEEEMYF